jgi:hypothetical protein
VATGYFHVENNHSWQPGVIFAAFAQTPRGSGPGNWEWGKKSGKSWPLDFGILGRDFFSHFGGSKWTGDHPQEEFSQIWLQVGQREKLEKFWSSTSQNAKTLWYKYGNFNFFIWSSKYGGFVPLFPTKSFVQVTALFFWSPSGQKKKAEFLGRTFLFTRFLFFSRQKGKRTLFQFIQVSCYPTWLNLFGGFFAWVLDVGFVIVRMSAISASRMSAESTSVNFYTLLRCTSWTSLLWQFGISGTWYCAMWIERERERSEFQLRVLRNVGEMEQMRNS